MAPLSEAHLCMDPLLSSPLLSCLLHVHFSLCSPPPYQPFSSTPCQSRCPSIPPFFPSISKFKTKQEKKREGGKESERQRRKDRSPQRKRKKCSTLSVSTSSPCSPSPASHYPGSHLPFSLQEVIMAKVTCALLITKSRGPWSLFI